MVEASTITTTITIRDGTLCRPRLPRHLRPRLHRHLRRLPTGMAIIGKHSDRRLATTRQPSC